MATLADVLGRYHEALPYPSAACGVIAAVCGRFVAMDAFDSPSTLEAIWGRLVASYAMDAEVAPDRAQKPFTANAAGVLVEHVAEQSSRAFRAVGLGEDLRFEALDVLGQTLQADGHLLHLSAFPASSKQPDIENPGPGISPPSRRRR
jgi:hypothetical protein